MVGGAGWLHAELFKARILKGFLFSQSRKPEESIPHGNFPSPWLSKNSWEAAVLAPRPSLKGRFPPQKAEAGARAQERTEGRRRGQQAHACLLKATSCLLKATSR